jgi:hypothetical protein
MTRLILISEPEMAVENSGLVTSKRLAIGHLLPPQP